MALTQRFRDSSQRLINRFGCMRTYKHITGQNYNVDTQMMESTVLTYTIKTFKTDPKEREIKSPNLIDQETAVMLVAAADLPIKPKVGDSIVGDNAETFIVTVVKESWAGDAIASWRLICIRG